jgi:hypothetical protein
MYLEPLAGLLRHPYSCIPVAPNQKWYLHKDWLLLDPIMNEKLRAGGKNVSRLSTVYVLVAYCCFIAHNTHGTLGVRFVMCSCSALLAQAKAFYFDAGASIWDSGGGGPSQSWFYKMFLERGVVFDGGMFLWEVQQYPQDRIYGQLPPSVKVVTLMMYLKACCLCPLPDLYPSCFHVCRAVPCRAVPCVTTEC